MIKTFKELFEEIKKFKKDEALFICDPTDKEIKELEYCFNIKNLKKKDVISIFDFEPNVVFFKKLKLYGLYIDNLDRDNLFFAKICSTKDPQKIYNIIKAIRKCYV